MTKQRWGSNPQPRTEYCTELPVRAPLTTRPPDPRHSDGDQQLPLQAERGLVTGDRASINRAATFFGIEPERAHLHVQMLHDICKQRKIQLASLSDVVGVLQDGALRAILPDCVKLVRIVLTAPATSCTAERSFSVLRRLKTWLRSTLTQERLSQGAVQASHPEKLDVLEVEKEMREFVSQTPQGVNAFGWRWLNWRVGQGRKEHGKMTAA